MKLFNLKNRKPFTNNVNNIFYILLIIFLVFAIGFIVNYLMGNKLTNSYEGLENKKSIVAYYWMDGCQHCKNFNAEWDKFASYHNKNPELTVYKVQNTDKNIPSEHEKVIEGYPTVLLEKTNGEIVVYSGDRTEAALNDWLKSFM